VVTPENMNGFYTIIEFAVLLKVHPNTIRRQIKNGRIEALKICNGKKILYRIPYSEVNRIALFDLKEYIERIIEDRMKD